MTKTAVVTRKLRKQFTFEQHQWPSVDSAVICTIGGYVDASLQSNLSLRSHCSWLNDCLL